MESLATEEADAEYKVVVGIPASESPLSLDKISKNPIAFATATQGASTSGGRKLSVMPQSTGQSQFPQRLSIIPPSFGSSPRTSRRTSMMTSVNISGHLLRIESREQGSRRASSIRRDSQDAGDTITSHRNSYTAPLASDRRASVLPVLDIAEVARRVQQRGNRDRSQPSALPTTASFDFQFGSDDSSSDDEEDELQEGDVPDDEPDWQGLKLSVGEALKSRKTIAASAIESTSERRVTVKPQKQKRTKANASKEVVDTVVDARAMAMRQATLIKQWIQDAADEASKCHEKWLSRRKKIRDDTRTSVSVKSEERIESDTKKIVQRLRRKRKTGIATRLVGASSPRASFLGASSLNGGQTMSAQATVSFHTGGLESIGAEASNSRNPHADLVSTLSTLDDASRSISECKNLASALPTTSDAELTIDNGGKFMSRPHSTPSTQTGGRQSASSSSVGLYSGASPILRSGHDAQSNSPMITSVEQGSVVKLSEECDYVFPSGFSFGLGALCNIRKTSDGHGSDAGSSDDSQHGLSTDGFDSDEQSRPSSQRASQCSSNPLIEKLQLPKISTEVRLHDPSDDNHDEGVDGLCIISEMEMPEVPEAAGKTRRVLATFADSEDNIEIESGPHYDTEKLPELPRLRSKFRDYRSILHDKWRNEARTVKRFHLQLAEQLGLEESDWSWMGDVYSVSVQGFEHAAELKDQRTRVEAASKVQATWRALRLYRLTMKLCRDRLRARETIQRWWRHYMKFRAPVQNRVKRRPAIMLALLRIQAFARGRVTRHHVAVRRQLHSVSWRMQCLKKELGGYDDAEVIRVQSMVRGYLACRQARLLRNKRELAKQAALEAELKEEREKNRRMSFMRPPAPNLARGPEVMKTCGRRASEVISFRPMALKSESGLTASVSPPPITQRADPVQEDQLEDGGFSSSSSENESETGFGTMTPTETPIPERAGNRISTSTPLGRRLKRPLDSEVARMGGLRKQYGNVAETVRRQPKKKATRTKLGSFTLPAMKQLPNMKQKEAEEKNDHFAYITISIPAKKKLEPLQVHNRTTTRRRVRKA